MTEEETLLEFPCDFPIKAMGVASDDFHTVVVGLVRLHAPDLPDSAVKSRPRKFNGLCQRTPMRVPRITGAWAGDVGCFYMCAVPSVCPGISVD